MITAEDYNKNISAKGEATFGFQATKSANETVAITNISVN